MQALASTLNEDEIADLKDQFQAFDVDKNGVISLEEMRQVRVTRKYVHLSYTFTQLLDVSVVAS